MPANNGFAGMARSYKLIMISLFIWTKIAVKN